MPEINWYKCVVVAWTLAVVLFSAWVWICW